MSLLGYGLAGALQGAGSGLAKQANANKAAALESLRQSLADNSVRIERDNRTPAPQIPWAFQTEPAGIEPDVSPIPTPLPKPTGEMREFLLAGSQGFDGTFQDYQAGMNATGGRNVNSNRNRAPAGYLYIDPDDPEAGLRAIPGGPAERLDPDFAGPIGLAEDALEQLGDVEKAAETGAMTGAVDFIGGNLLGRGDAGRFNRELKAGAEALTRMLAGAGMKAADAEREAEMYLPSFADDATSLANKVSQLRRRLASVLEASKRGREANPSDPGGQFNDPLGIR